MKFTVKAQEIWKRKKKGGDIKMDKLKGKSWNAPRVGATNRVNKKLGGDR